MTKSIKNPRQNYGDDPDHREGMSPITASQDGWGFAWQLAKREMRGSLGRFRVFRDLFLRNIDLDAL